MSWDYFIYFSSVAVILWIIGAVLAFTNNKRLLPTLFTVAGLVIFFMFIVGMWISLERPPLRTMGETRLWYSFFLPVVGLITYERWRYKWLLSFSTLLSTVWSWDPKETWAAATWISYLIYIHVRLKKDVSYRTAMIVLIISFVMLQICWWGLNYLPSAQRSIHVYS